MHVNPALQSRTPNGSLHRPLPTTRAPSLEADTAQHGNLKLGAVEANTHGLYTDVMREQVRQSRLQRWQQQGRER